MTEPDMRRATLAEIEAMHRRGELHYNPDAPEGEDLGDEFWAEAVLVPGPTRPVQLEVASEVLEFFSHNSGEEGPLSRMQAVLLDYVRSQRR